MSIYPADNIDSGAWNGISWSGQSFHFHIAGAQSYGTRHGERDGLPSLPTDCGGG